MAKYYPECRERIHVIPNGVDLNRFQPVNEEDRLAARNQLGIEKNTTALLFISNNYRLKGLYDLINALPLLLNKLDKNVLVLVIGRCNPRPFKHLAQRKGLLNQMRFIDGTKDIRNYYAATDALLHPTYYDACANVCLEAAACGLPVLTSTNNGGAELLQDAPAAVFVDMPCERKNLVDALQQTVANAAQTALRKQQAEYMQRHTIEKNYNAVETLYATLANQL